jgi:hypothetical protein
MVEIIPERYNILAKILKSVNKHLSVIIIVFSELSAKTFLI